jgi:CRP/FNR family transcriptional regulator, cyclic AMP receptor protein
MEDVLTAIRPLAVNRTFKKRSILLYQGEAPRAAFVITNGLIKAYSLNTAGEEQIVSFYVRGDMFPTPWIFDKSSSTLYYYEALTDCEVMVLPKDELRKIAFSKPEFMQHMLDYFVTNHTGLLMRVTALEQSRASEKIMFTLYYLLFRYGKEQRPGVYSLRLQLTQSIIASLVGLTRETTATELGKLRRQKILDYTAQQYTVNKQALERALGEDNFTDVQIN